MVKPSVGDIVWEVHDRHQRPVIVGPLRVVKVGKNSWIRLRHEIYKDFEYNSNGWFFLRHTYESALADLVYSANRIIDEMSSLKLKAQTLTEDDYIALQIERQERKERQAAADAVSGLD